MTSTTTTDEPATTSEQPPPRRRLPKVLALLVGVALVGLGGWALFIRDDAKPSGTIPNASASDGAAATIPPVAAGTTDTEAAQLLALLAKGRTATFHATYTVTDPANPGATQSIEVWRHNGNIRQDTVVKSDSGTSHTAGYIVNGHAASCLQQDDGAWACSQLPDPGADVDGIFGSVASQLQGVDVTVTDETVGGHKASCFSFPASDGTGTLCVTPDGIQVKLAGNGQDITIADLASSVDDAVFVTPAEPTPPASS
ncbi:MAG: hypothetical protein QOE63_1059 [Acidimicrobiaceae bacterium]